MKEVDSPKLLFDLMGLNLSMGSCELAYALVFVSLLVGVGWMELRREGISEFVGF